MERSAFAMATRKLGPAPCSRKIALSLTSPLCSQQPALHTPRAYRTSEQPHAPTPTGPRAHIANCTPNNAETPGG